MSVSLWKQHVVCSIPMMCVESSMIKSNLWNNPPQAILQATCIRSPPSFHARCPSCYPSSHRGELQTVRFVTHRDTPPSELFLEMPTDHACFNVSCAVLHVDVQYPAQLLYKLIRSTGIRTQGGWRVRDIHTPRVLLTVTKTLEGLTVSL